MAILEEPIRETLQLKNYVDGEWVESEGEIKDVVNPTTGQSHRDRPTDAPCCTSNEGNPAPR